MLCAGWLREACRLGRGMTNPNYFEASAVSGFIRRPSPGDGSLRRFIWLKGCCASTVPTTLRRSARMHQADAFECTAKTWRSFTKWLSPERRSLFIADFFSPKPVVSPCLAGSRLSNRTAVHYRLRSNADVRSPYLNPASDHPLRQTLQAVLASSCHLFRCRPSRSKLPRQGI